MDDSALTLPEKSYLDRKFVLQQPTRRKQRRAVAQKWLAETEYSYYRYFVAECKSGTRIYLSRPGRRNRGFDFAIHIEGWTSPYAEKGKMRNTRPSHGDIFEDLRRKKSENPQRFKKLARAIREVYRCAEPSETQARNLANFEHGLEVDVLLHVLKWLFIEQDLTYWNGTGRRMLWKDGLAGILDDR